MKRKWLAIGISTVSVVLLILASFSNVVGYQSVKSTIHPDSPLSTITISERHFQSDLSYPSVEWDRVYGEQSSHSYSVCEDSDGDSVVTGSVHNDIVLIKTDTNGNLVWNRSFDGVHWFRSDETIPICTLRRSRCI